MDIKDIKKIIYEAICEIQKLSGRCLPSDFCETLIPLKDMDGFDSLNAIEITVQLSEKFDCPINDNPFVSGNKALNVEEIAQKILNKIDKRVNTK